MVLPFLAESVREPSKAAVTHTGTEIRTLHDRRADAFRIGLSVNWDNLHGLNLGRAVTRFALGTGAIDLNEFRVASEPVVKGRRDC
jgi:hypothetical protein